jgi:hypothetical protein
MGMGDDVKLNDEEEEQTGRMLKKGEWGKRRRTMTTITASTPLLTPVVW